MINVNQEESVCLIWDIDCNSTHVFPRSFEDFALQIKFVQFIYLLEIDWGVMNPYLLPDSDVSLLDQDTCMVDGLRKSKLEHLGLKTAFKKVVNFQTKNII